MKNKFSSYFIILLLCLTYSNSFYKAITRDEPFILRFENEKEKQDDPLEFSEDYFRDSFKNFINFLTGKDSLDSSYCYQQFSGESVRVSKEFLSRFNDFIESAEKFKTKNKNSKDIKINTECLYNEKSYNSALDLNMKFSRKSLYDMKDSLMFFMRSDFWENFQSFLKCAEKENELYNYSEFTLLETNEKFEEIFNSLCSIQNLLYLFNKKLDKLSTKDPFAYIGKTFKEYLLYIRPHIINIQHSKIESFLKHLNR